MLLIKSGQVSTVKLFPIASKGVGRGKSVSSGSVVRVVVPIALLLGFTVVVARDAPDGVACDEVCVDVLGEALPVDIGGASSS